MASKQKEEKKLKIYYLMFQQSASLSWMEYVHHRQVALRGTQVNRFALGSHQHVTDLFPWAQPRRV